MYLLRKGTKMPGYGFFKDIGTQQLNFLGNCQCRLNFWVTLCTHQKRAQVPKIDTPQTRVLSIVSTPGLFILNEVFLVFGGKYHNIRSPYLDRVTAPFIDSLLPNFGTHTKGRVCQKARPSVSWPDRPKCGLSVSSFHSHSNSIKSHCARKEVPFCCCDHSLP